MKETFQVPTPRDIEALIGTELYNVWRELFSNEVQMIYDETTTFHDGKWIMFELKNTELFNDMERLLLIKRKPNKKSK